MLEGERRQECKTSDSSTASLKERHLISFSWPLLIEAKDKSRKTNTGGQEMRGSASERRRRGRTRVPAVNKSTPAAGSALGMLASGMESKRSGNTRAPTDRRIKTL